MKRLIRKMLGVEDRVAVGREVARQHLFPAASLPAIPQSRVSQRRRDSPALAEFDLELTRSERLNQTGEALSRFVVEALETRPSRRDWRPVRHVVSPVACILATRRRPLAQPTERRRNVAS